MWSYMAITNPTTPAQYVIILLDLAHQRGVRPAAVLENTSLSETNLASIGARISEEDFTHIIESCYRLTGDPALGLHLGLRLNLSAHATVGQAFMTCENLQQVITFFLKYYRILAPALELEYEVSEGRFWLTPQAPYQVEREEFSFELLFAAIVQTIQFLLNRPDLEFRLELPYPEPEYADEYRTIFGSDLHFNCSRGRISFPDHWLNAPLPSSNPALLNLFEQECQRLLANLEDQDSLAEQTLQVLRKLEGHYPQRPQVANMLNMSPRT